MKNLIEHNTNCLIVVTKFSEFSYWNYKEVCEIAGAKYPTAPLGPMTVAALLPQNWNFKLIDENVDTLTPDHFKWADLICTGGMLPQQNEILKLIQKAHEAGKPVVVGGPDPTSQPEIYHDADFLVCGEGEVAIPIFLTDLASGATHGIYTSENMADMSNSVIPRFDLINFKNYLMVGIQFSRGCPFTCEFCDIIELYGRKPRMKSLGQILAELQKLYDLGYRGLVDFVDDNFIGNKHVVKKTLVEILKWSEKKKHPFYFSTEASINLAEDDDLLRLMRAVDFRMVFIGIETPDNEILKEMGKKQNVNKHIPDMITKILDYGIVVNGGFILGFDNETDKTAANMISLIENSGIAMAMAGLLFALPNTQLIRRLRIEGRMPDANVRPDTSTGIDQFSSGLNFKTARPRINILNDFAQVIAHIYHPKNYFERVKRIACQIRPSGKFKPDLSTIFRLALAFMKVSVRLGFNRKTGFLYWSLLARVGIKNFKGLETAGNLAAMYIHFEKQSLYILNVTSDKIKNSLWD
jgi:radical SAM superfamily enzyme YgiQ (UPF0313 family)